MRKRSEPTLKVNIEMGNKQMKKCSTSKVIREIQIKTIRHHSTSITLPKM